MGNWGSHPHRKSGVKSGKPDASVSTVKDRKIGTHGCCPSFECFMTSMFDMIHARISHGHDRDHGPELHGHPNYQTAHDVMRLNLKPAPIGSCVPTGPDQSQSCCSAAATRKPTQAAKVAETYARAVEQGVDRRLKLRREPVYSCIFWRMMNRIFLALKKITNMSLEIRF